MTDNFHPAVCPQCCRRAVARGRGWQTLSWAGDAGFIVGELAEVAAGALLNLYALTLFLSAFFNGKRRRLTVRDRQGLAELRSSQFDIERRERNALALRRRTLDDIACSPAPRDRPYRELDELDGQLEEMAANWEFLEKTRLQIEYRK